MRAPVDKRAGTCLRYRIVTRSQRVNGETIRALRERSGLSGTALAKLIEIDRAYLSHIEAGRRQPSPANAKAIADALKVPITAILSEVTEAAS